MAYSSTNGSFHVVPERKWDIVRLFSPFRLHARDTAIYLTAPGYMAYTNSSRTGVLGPSVVKLGRVELARER